MSYMSPQYHVDVRLNATFQDYKYKCDIAVEREAKLTKEEVSLLKSDESCLTKGEEKALKRVRRKIKNKVP